MLTPAVVVIHFHICKKRQNILVITVPTVITFVSNICLLIIKHINIYIILFIIDKPN